MVSLIVVMPPTLIQQLRPQYTALERLTRFTQIPQYSRFWVMYPRHLQDLSIKIVAVSGGFQYEDGFVLPMACIHSLAFSRCPRLEQDCDVCAQVWTPIVMSIPVFIPSASLLLRHQCDMRIIILFLFITGVLCSTTAYLPPRCCHRRLTTHKRFTLATGRAGPSTFELVFEPTLRSMMNSLNTKAIMHLPLLTIPPWP